MAKRAYYREYRPYKLTEVMGQPHITRTLENALKSGIISHAYLFSGPRGVGKTSVARIFAHEINDIPYDDDSTHLDIIEIDAASNRRIDEIRDLREKIGITPTSSKYKVYIIDEVHMLTKEAFNALLKTLEEPPEHAIFILATTEAHRLPDTILSRTQHHTFKPISLNDQVKHLTLIAKKEKIKISAESLTLLAVHASGSYRDGLSLLDQLATSHGKTIELTDVMESLGLAPEQLVTEVLVAVNTGDSKLLLELIDKAFAESVSAQMLAKQIVAHLQAQWAIGESYSVELLKLADGLLAVQGASEPEIKMTIVVLEACLNSPQFATVDKTKRERSREQVKQTSKPSAAPKAKTPSIINQTFAAKSLEDVVETREFDHEAWQRALTEIKNTNNSLYAVLRMAHAGLNGDDDVVILTFQFPFHQKQVNSAKNKKIVEEVLSEAMGQTVSLKLVVDRDLNVSSDGGMESDAPVNNMTDEQINSVIDIMGGGEVVSI